jgi:hypothetical protein
MIFSNNYLLVLLILRFINNNTRPFFRIEDITTIKMNDFWPTCRELLPFNISFDKLLIMRITLRVACHKVNNSFSIMNWLVLILNIFKVINIAHRIK